MNEELRCRIFLAALLHDVGKFYQRADKSFSDKYNELSSYSRKIAEDICPINEHGRFGYQHVVWTNEFLEKYGGILLTVPGVKTNNSDSDDSLASFACNHHKPRTELQALVTLADWWSAGIDRTDPSTLEREQNEDTFYVNWGRDRYKRIPLYSVFNSINGGCGRSAFSLRPLDIDENRFFPKEINVVSDGVSQEEYKKLWEPFCDEFKNLPFDSYRGFAESLTYLLKKYTWCIPSNTMDMANVSLYEHLKTTAAFADCFCVYHQYNPSAFKWDGTRISLAEGEKPVILLGGDISGIQNFIYNVSSKKAAISLKGRSFYLQLLIDSVIRKILSHPNIDATVAQVVYSSGGKFYMLLPNTPNVLAAIDTLRNEFDRRLWEEHKGALLLNIDCIPFAFDVRTKTVVFDNSGPESRIGDLWRALAERLTSCKNTRFKSVVLKENLFIPEEIPSEAKVCAVSGVEGNCVDIANVGDENLWVLPSVKKQCDLGMVLKDADYIITHLKSDDASKFLANRSKFGMEIMGVHTYLFDKKELTADDSEFRGISSVDVCKVTAINSLIVPHIKGNACSYAFQFYGGNKQAMVGDRNKTFEELSGGEYLGILRMDVDNLGAIFIKGLPETSKSFAAYSTLSFMLDWFFSGYLNTIREKFKDDVNILYSGGDDVFAIGKWDKVISFAKEVREAFSKFIGRDDISISAGVVIVAANYPIAKAAELAGDAESRAKGFDGCGKGLPKKNAINMFGESVSWEREFDIVMKLKTEFVDLIENEGMPRSILHRLMTLCGKMKSGDMSYMWHTTYFLKRFSDGKTNSVKDFCKRMKIELCEGRKYELTALAARWAELELRFKN